MDDRLSRTINRVKTWEELRDLEVNIGRKDALSEEVRMALKERSSALGVALIIEKTGIDVSNPDDLSPAERKIIYVIGEYVGICKAKGRYPGRTLSQIRNRGLIDAAESAVSKSKPTQGFQTLVDADLEDLSYEQIVLDHPEEFSERAIWYSRRTLGLENRTASPPAPDHSDTQTLTATLLAWLKARAEEKNGSLGVFTNAQAAKVLGYEDMQRFGQAYGNLQSRIDFACYLCGLPPLGCAAEVPFSEAWAKQGRDWEFPIAEMRVAAKGRLWSPHDFDLVIRESEKLPAKATPVWNDALTNNERLVKDWAFGFADVAANQPSGVTSNVSGDRDDKRKDDVGAKAKTIDVDDDVDPNERSRRNPPWTRDELILALELYLKDRKTPLGSGSKEVAELSDFLNVMGLALGFDNRGTYRNANGVFMKLMNFRRFDIEYTKNGKKGLERGNKDEEIVWAEFAAEPARLALVCAAIRLAVTEHQDDYELAGIDDPGIVDAPEGRVLTRVHRVRERSRKLVEQAKALAQKKHGRLACEACGFEFAEKYGPIGEGIIEVHHTKPIHTLVEGDRTKTEDLALLCANCHRVVHSSRNWLSVAEVASLVRR